MEVIIIDGNEQQEHAVFAGYKVSNTKLFWGNKRLGTILTIATRVLN